MAGNVEQRLKGQKDGAGSVEHNVPATPFVIIECASVSQSAKEVGPSGPFMIVSNTSWKESRHVFQSTGK